MRWVPVLIQGVQTDSAVFVYIGVVDFGLETDFWWLDWIVLREFDVEVEDAPLVRRARWALESGLPGEKVVGIGWLSGNVGDGVSFEELEFSL